VTDSAQSHFLDEHGKPRLCRCALVFIDLLGVRAMATSPGAGSKLVELKEALQRPLGDLLSPSSPWLASFFSDTLVLVDPVRDALPPFQAMGGLAIQAASLQINLAVSSFFIRGAMTVGEVHLHDGLLYGPALVEAYELEQTQAVNPRIVLSQEAIHCMRDAMKGGELEEEPPFLMREQDGTVFIDYLDVISDDIEDPAVGLRMHKEMVEGELAKHLDDARRWEKYRWVAEYHNAYIEAEHPKASTLLLDSADSIRTYSRIDLGNTPARPASG
jgi:hypothetical protein